MEDIQHADNYVLAVVLFAACLFFAGISTNSLRQELLVSPLSRDAIEGWHDLIRAYPGTARSSGPR